MHKSIARFAVLVGVATFLPAGVRAQSPGAFDEATLEVTSEWTGQDRGDGSGNYRLLTELFNMPAGDYKRFLNTLRKHNCHVAFQEFRTLPGRREGDSEKIA